ncbi:restriction endonuclease subunit S [Eubacterium sp. LMAG:50]|uniref:restriction endonuclease subunit S n=1 Tax=Eubacterium sp. LMAG:50 TaxID=1969563 RepID=UPI0025C33BA4|nr:restriction endonuclease subunit S [Eubacterium sp. LMAG:50]
MVEWIECSIGDLCSTISDTYKGNDEYVVLVNTSDVLEGKVLNHEAVVNKNLKGQFKKTFKREDILYSEIRPANKRFAYIDFENTSNYIASTKLMVLRHNDKVLPEYLFALLKSNYVIAELQHLAETRSGTFPQITFSSELAPMKVLLPDKDVQKRIVSILSSIEEKIDENTSINNNLEQQAQAIFDNMFPNISNGSCAIGDYITPKRGKSLLSKNAIFGDVPVIAGGLEPSTYHNVANTQSPVLAISASGANAGYVSLWNIPIWSSDSSYIDSSMTDDVYFWYVLLKKRQKEIFDAQTGSAQPHIYPQHIASMSVSNLDIEEVHSYTSIVTPIFEKIGHHKEENTRLASLRDTLLPKLMSGELDVSDIKL